MNRYLRRLTFLLVTSLLFSAGCQNDTPSKPEAPKKTATKPIKPEEVVSKEKPQDTSAPSAATSTDPTADTAKLTLDDIFSRDHVIDVQITVPQKDWDTIRFQSRNIMTALQPQRQFEPVDGPYTYVNAKVTIDGVEFPNVGLRKKGFIGSQSSTRPSLKVKLDYVDKKANIEGLETLTFNNNQQDISHMSQFMSYAFFNAVGSPASRCALAKITINGTSLGIYSHVESVRKHLFEREFGSDKGTLYEGTVVDFFPDWEGSFENKFGKDKKARKKIVELINVLEGKEGNKILSIAAAGRAWVPVNAPDQGDENLAAYPGNTDDGDTNLQQVTAKIAAIKKVLSTPTPALAAAQAKWEQAAVRDQIAMTPWSMTGPFQLASFNQAYDQALPPEKKIDLESGYDWGDNTLTWIQPQKLVDGQPFRLGGQPNAARYFFRTITSLSPRKLAVSLGSDDALKVWINGKLQFENKTQRGIDQDRDETELNLVAGENQLLIKIVNGVGESGFFFQAQQESMPATLLAALKIPLAEREASQKTLVDDYFFKIAPELQAARDQLAVATRQYYERWTKTDFDDSSWTAGKNGAGLEMQQGYQDLINPSFNFADAMHQKNASLYLRFPFEIADLDQVSDKAALNLRVKYDDGFVAFLNGHQVASANAPAIPRWNSQATQGHDDPAAMQFEIFNISKFRDKLQQGKNVLAIHAMNVDAASTDMLMVAEIETNDFDYEEAIGELVDLDAFYKFWAVEGLLGFWDGYSGNRNNFFIYLNPETDKFHFLPWGADALFEKFSKLRVDRRAPVSVKTMGRIAHRLYQLPASRERYAKTMQDLLDNHWDEEALLAEVDRAQAMIKPHLTSAQQKALPRGEIRRFIPTRRADVFKEIRGDMPLWASAPGPPPVIGAPNNNNNLWMAARKGNLGLVKRQLGRQNVNSRDKDGQTALNQATLGGHKETVAFLLQKGAQVNARDKDGNTALHTAAFLGRLEIAQLLVAEGANVNLKNDEEATPLANAAGPWNEQVEGVVQFLTSALQIKIDQDRMKAGRPKVAEFLRSKGGKLAANLPANGDGLEIWQATSTGDLELLKKVLADGTNVNVRADDGATPLINATVASQLEAVALLVEKGANVNALTNDRNSSLHAAAFIGNLEIVQLLVASKANLNLRNQEGETPLDSASGPWNEELQETVKYLNELLGITIDEAAMKTGRPKVAVFLSGKGGKSARDLPRRPGQSGQSRPGGAAQGDLWTAAKTGNLAALNQHISKKADLNAQDARMGLTPLALASMGGHVEAAKLIISKGGEVNAKNKDGSVPLHGASFLGRVDIVKLLVENKANVNLKNAMGETPLDSAAAEWNAQIQGIVQFVGTILQIKVDTNTVKAGRPQVAELLRQNGGKTKDQLD